LVPNGDELLVIAGAETGQQVVTHFNLLSGESRTEEFGEPPPATLAGRRGAKSPGATSGAKSAAVARSSTNQMAKANASAARSGQPGAKPLDPAAVAARVQNLSTPAKLALPAVLAANANQQRLVAEMQINPHRRPPRWPRHRWTPSCRADCSQPGTGLCSSREVDRVQNCRAQSMKDPPKKSALEGTVNAPPPRPSPTKFSTKSSATAGATWFSKTSAVTRSSYDALGEGSCGLDR